MFTYDNPGCYHDAIRYLSKVTGQPTIKDLVFNKLEQLYRKPSKYAPNKRKLIYKATSIYLTCEEGKQHPFYDTVTRKFFYDLGIVAKEFRVTVEKSFSDFDYPVEAAGMYNDCLGGGWSQKVQRWRIDEQYFAMMDCKC